MVRGAEDAQEVHPYAAGDGDHDGKVNAVLVFEHRSKLGIYQRNNLSSTWICSHFIVMLNASISI